MMAASQFPDHFSGVARNYQSARPGYPDELFEFVAGSVPVCGHAWDCATGTGQAASGLARYFRQVSATDASEEQIRHAIPVSNVQYSVQLAENTNFPEACFDVVTVAQALHWFDVDRFEQEIKRVLKPGGALTAWTYGFFHIDPTIDELVRSGFLEPIDPFWPPQNRLAWNGYADIGFDLPGIEVPEIPMSIRWNLFQLVDYLSTWSAYTRYVEQYGEGLLETLVDRIEISWGAADESKPVKMDFHLRGWRQPG